MIILTNRFFFFNPNRALFKGSNKISFKEVSRPNRNNLNPNPNGNHPHGR